MAWRVKAKHCQVLSTNFWTKSYWHHPPVFALLIQVNISGWCQQTVFKRLLTTTSNVLPLQFTPQANFCAHNLNFHWRWSWWDPIQATFLNFFNFTCSFLTSKAALLCWRLSHKTSKNTITHAKVRPPIKTTKTPPTLLRPSSAAPPSVNS